VRRSSLPRCCSPPTTAPCGSAHPLVDGVRVRAEIVAQGRARKILVYKKKRRKNYRRRKGHRQAITTLRVLEIAS
jgi:large subunit ribosomal protein L21